MINADFEIVFKCDCGSYSITQVIKTREHTIQTYWVCDDCGYHDGSHTFENQIAHYGPDWTTTQKPINREH
jgi:predicted RNA-binding Zn-ribbon protein involved in translation (DUF1610 family)